MESFWSRLKKIIKGVFAFCLFDSLTSLLLIICFYFFALTFKVSEAHANRLLRAVEVGLAHFDTNGGGAAEHGGAMYTQIAVAILCAVNCDMSK